MEYKWSTERLERYPQLASGGFQLAVFTPPLVFYFNAIPPGDSHRMKGSDPDRNVTLGPELAEVLHARLPSLGKAIGKATIPTSAGPKKPLPRKPEKITVEGASIQPGTQSRKGLIGRKKPSGFREYRQDFAFCHFLGLGRFVNTLVYDNLLLALAQN